MPTVREVFWEVSQTDSDDLEKMAESTLQARRNLRSFLARAVIATSCIVLSFLAGRASLHHEEVTNARRIVRPRHAIQYSERVSDSVEPFEYLATFSTQLRLENLTKKGDGWAPWQLVVSGDSHFNGEYCVPRQNNIVDADMHKIDCSRRTSGWIQFNVDAGSSETGVWGLYIDPEKELEEYETYEDEEIIETRLQATFTNELDEPTIMHFHGFTPPNNLDGIPWISANPIQPNATVFYDFVLYHRGFYWMHSHFTHHAGSGLFAPIIIKDSPAFNERLGNPTDIVMIILDSHWRAPCAYARHLHPEDCPVGGFDSWAQYTFNVNGHSLQGRNRSAEVVNVTVNKKYRLRVLDAGMMAMYRVYLAGLKGQVIATDGRRVKNASHKPITYFPLSSANRLDVLITIPEEGCYPITAVRTYPKDVKNAERGVLILKTPKGVCNESIYEPYKKNEKRLRHQELMAFQLKFEAMNGYSDLHKKPDVHHVVELTGKFRNSTGEWRPDYSFNETRYRLWPSMVWCREPECNRTDGCAPEESVHRTVLRQEFCQNEFIKSNVECERFKCAHGREADGDKNGRCFGNKGIVEDHWKHVPVNKCHLWKLRPSRFMYITNPLKVCHGDRVWITFLDAGTHEPHPIHMHGMHQQLIYINGEKVNGPLQDTWLAYNTSFTVAFDALNPGEWLLHCHYEHHMMNGMATTVKYVMDGRCRDRLDFRERATWRFNAPVQEDEWPESWHGLWNKRKPNVGLIFQSESKSTTSAIAATATTASTTQVSIATASTVTTPSAPTIAATGAPASTTQVGR